MRDSYLSLLGRACCGRARAGVLLSVKIVLIDFHTHTTASDGALSPAELVAQAAGRNVDLLAITDNDTVAGYLAVAGDYTHIPPAMRIIPGIEFSCRWSGTTIHVLGLDMDVTAPAMREGLARLDRARRERGIKIAELLDKQGFPGALDGARAEA